MAQIKLPEQRLEKGDYAVIKMTRGTVQGIVVLYAYSDEESGLYTNTDNLFNGSERPRMRTTIRELRRSSHSWVLDNPITFNRAMISLGSGVTFTIIGEDMSIEEAMRTTIDNVEQTSSFRVREFRSSNYEVEKMYSGIHCYHGHHGSYLNKPTTQYKKHRIGVELEVEFHDSNKLDTFTSCKSNWFYCERDGSLGCNGCEIITIPLLPKDAKSVEHWKELTEFIKDHASSWDTGRCGLHVHIGREILGETPEKQSETLGKLLYLYHHHVKDTRLNIDVFGRERGYHERDGKTKIGEAACVAMQEFDPNILRKKDVIYKVTQAMLSKTSEDRYFDINTMNAHTIEFRKGRGSINPSRITRVIEYCEKMCIYAKTTPWVQISYDDFVNYLRATSSDEARAKIESLM